MYPEAYKEWIEIFNDELLEVWQKEQKELQKVAMLLSALQRELKNVRTSVEVDVINIRQQLKHKGILKERQNYVTPYKDEKKESPTKIGKGICHDTCKENEYDSKLVETAEISEDITNLNEAESPDLFRNVISPTENAAESSVIDLSISDEDAASPTIKRRRKHKSTTPATGSDMSSDSKQRIYPATKIVFENDSEKANLFNTPTDNDMSVIENTPEITDSKNSKKEKMSKKKAKSARASTSTLTSLTHIFGRSKRKSSSTFSITNVLSARASTSTLTSLTHIFGRSKRKSSSNISKKPEQVGDLDETYLLNKINKDETTTTYDVPVTLQSTNKETENEDLDATYFETTKETEANTTHDEKAQMVDRATDETMNMDSGDEIDEFSKGAIFNDSEVASPTAEKPKINFPKTESKACTPKIELKVITPCPEPVVRGKARKQLQGWACDQCKDFYTNMNLDAKTMKKRMDECSKHRYKYYPPSDTLPGFWDYSIPPEHPK